MDPERDKVHASSFTPTPQNGIHSMQMLAMATWKQQQQRAKQQQTPPIPPPVVTPAPTRRSTVPQLSMPNTGFIGTPTLVELSPRKQTKYGPVRWNMHAITSWISILLSFVALIMVGIMYANWHGGELTGLRTVEPEVAKREEIDAPPPSRGHVVQFTLKGLPGQYSRWPEGTGTIEGLDMFALSETRLCCRVGNRYFMCDYGQGASSDLGVECFVEYSATEGGAHLLVNVQSEHMNGAQCFFHWKTQEQQKINS